MIKKTLIRAAVGFLIGMVMGDLIAFLTGLPSGAEGLPVSDAFAARMGDPLSALIVQTLVSGLFGAICFSGISLHDCERLPLMASCLLHCGIMITVFVPVSVFLCWVSSLSDILIMAGIQIAVYFIIWLIMYALYKKEIRELNNMQEKYLNEKNTIIQKEEKL